jgi:hypothetical protein
MSKKPFVFNDQNQKNSYGFRILTQGINLDRFNKNPVMLNQHYNSTSDVLGKWENIRVENDLLLGDPLFDSEDADSMKIAGKVERDFINSCSMGILINPDDLKIIGSELLLEKCELYECSIVAVPSNANSIRLYAQNGELLKEDDVKHLCLSLQQKPEKPREPNKNPKTTDMKKITLSLAVLTALSFDKETPEVEVEKVEAAVLKMSNELVRLKAEKLALESAAEQAQETAINDMVDLSIKEGRIPATKKDDFVALAKANFELAKNTLAAIPAKASLANQVIPPAAGAVTSKEDFQKLSFAQQLEFKTQNPDEYKKLFNVK